MLRWDNLQYFAPVFSVAQPKMKPVTATALAIVICLPGVNITMFYLQELQASS